MRFSSLFSVLLSFITFVCAQNGQNAFTAPLGGVLDSSQPLTINWKPTTQGTITIKLLKGPPTNILEIDTIAEKIENSGTLTWNIPHDLQDSGSMDMGHKYGFKIYDDETGTFEYSPPFDISIPDSTYDKKSSTSSSASASASATKTKASQLPSATTTSNATQTSSADKKDEPGPNLTLIVAVAAGVIGGLVFLIVAIVMICRCKNRRNRQSTAPTQNVDVMAQRPISVVYGDGMYNRV